MIDYPKFLLLSSVVNRAYMQTLVRLKEEGNRGPEDFQSELYSLGLMKIKIDRDRIEERAGWGDNKDLLPLVKYEANQHCVDLLKFGLS
jgi:hypothetical protein